MGKVKGWENSGGNQDLVKRRPGVAMPKRSRRAKKETLIKIHFCFAAIAFDHPAKQSVAALRADVTGLFIFDPFFSPDFPPVGNRPQDHLFAHAHGKILDMAAGKLVAFVTSGIPLGLGAIPDGALPAMHKRVFGQAALALDIVHGQGVTVRKRTLARNIPLVDIQEPFLEFLIVVPVGDIDAANPAIQTTRRYKIRIDGHVVTP